MLIKFIEKLSIVEAHAWLDCFHCVHWFAASVRETIMLISYYFLISVYVC